MLSIFPCAYRPLYMWGVSVLTLCLYLEGLSCYYKNSLPIIDKHPVLVPATCRLFPVSSVRGRGNLRTRRPACPSGPAVRAAPTRAFYETYCQESAARLPPKHEAPDFGLRYVP